MKRLLVYLMVLCANVLSFSSLFGQNCGQNMTVGISTNECSPSVNWTRVPDAWGYALTFVDGYTGYEFQDREFHEYDQSNMFHEIILRNSDFPPNLNNLSYTLDNIGEMYPKAIKENSVRIYVICNYPTLQQGQFTLTSFTYQDKVCPPFKIISPIPNIVCYRPGQTYTFDAVPIGGVFRLNGGDTTRNAVFTDLQVGKYHLEYVHNSRTTHFDFEITSNGSNNVEVLTDKIFFCQADLKSYPLKASVPGGVFSGPCVKDGSFVPGNCPFDSVTVNYRYEQSGNCTSTGKKTLYLHSQPLDIANDLYMNTVDFCLNDFHGEGYTFYTRGYKGRISGRGMAFSAKLQRQVFSPRMAGVGTHILTFTPDPSIEGCIATTTFKVWVNPSGTYQLKGITDGQIFCNTDTNKVRLSGTPFGGTWDLDNERTNTSTRKFDGTFRPSEMQPGNYVVYYSGCQNFLSLRFTIAPATPVKILFPAAQQRFCPNDTRFYEFKTNNESAGTFYLDGKKVTGKSFTPSNLAVGGHSLKFVSEGCNYQDSVSFAVLGIAQTECADACPTPAFTEGVFVQPNYVRLAWSTGAGLYELQMRPQGGVWASRTVSGTTYTYTGLSAGKTYEFRVKAFCNNAFSDWSMLRSVTLPVTLSCDAPAFSRQTNISATRATLTWQAVPNATGYRISISGQPSVTVTALSNTFTATFLRANSVYNYSIRAICPGNRVSAPSATYQFRTLTGKETEDCVNPYPYERIEIYPNPSKGIFTVRANCGTLIRISDLTGRIVFSSSIPKDKTELEIDLTGYTSGIYVIQADGYPSAKIIVE